MELQNIIQTIINEPIYLSIISILSLIIIYSVLKKLFKVLILCLSVMFVYVMYLVFSGQNLPGNIEVDPIKEKIETSINNAKKTFDTFIEDNKDEE